MFSTWAQVNPFNFLLKLLTIFLLENAFSAEIKRAPCLRSMKTLHAQEFPEWAFFPNELFSHSDWKIWPTHEDGADLCDTVKPAWG